MTGRTISKDLVPVSVSTLPITALAVAVLERTHNATFAADEFFKASISNEHTRRA